MGHLDTIALVRSGSLDPELAALLWLLVDGGVPLVVAGPAAAGTRASLARALVSTDPAREWVVLDADREPVTPDRLAALLRGGVAMAMFLEAPDLEGVMHRLARAGLPADGVRRLGVVAIVHETPVGARLGAVHYLRPTERDAQGHVQRRPPAVLATWDAETGAYEHYAWAVTPELADRVDRSQADLEERQHERAVFLAAAAGDDAPAAEQEARIARYLAAEPPRVPAPQHESARPSPFAGGLIDPDPHVH